MSYNNEYRIKNDRFTCPRRPSPQRQPPSGNAYCSCRAAAPHMPSPQADELYCKKREIGSCIDSLSLAMVYAPMQKWQEIYEAEEGLRRGTIFKELDLPWYPTSCTKEIR